MYMENGSKHSVLGFEYQMLDDQADQYNDLNPDQFTGSLYDLIPAGETNLKPLGEFNESRLIVNKNMVEHWLNGQQVLVYSLDRSEERRVGKECRSRWTRDRYKKISIS